MKTSRAVAAALSLALLALAAGFAPGASAREPFTPDPNLAPLKQRQQRAMLERARAKLARNRAVVEARRKAEAAEKARSPKAAALKEAAATLARKGQIARMPKVELGDDVISKLRAQRDAGDAGRPSTLAALATNVRVNNPSGDAADAGQAEAWLGVHGSNMLIAWNDGQGFNLASGDVQGYAWSTDGGQTWTDGGIPPKRNLWRWTSDPVIAVNPSTGVFYYCGLIDSGGTIPTHNGIGVVQGRFDGPGGAFEWDTVYAARMVSSTSSFLDKQWIAVNPTDGAVFVTYTNFNSITTAVIEVTRFNGTFWSPPFRLNTSGNGLVQGSRIVAGDNPNEMYAMWAEIGTTDVDFFRMRRTTDGGVNWGAQQTLPSYYSHWASGAPGFNRERGITFPSISVDRNPGSPYLGRVYVTWNESLNYYDDSNGYAFTSRRPEVEPNNTAGAATSFTPGQMLQGTVTNDADLDWFSFSATQGQTYMFDMDSLDADLDVAFRVLCTDGATRLQVSNLGLGAGGFMVFTAPTTGTYYVRAASFVGNDGTQPWPYRIRTFPVAAGPSDRARDHRDVFVTTSVTETGSSWTTPVRVNTEPGYYDDWLPEVAVGGNNRAYAIWYDWRDAAPTACGGESNVYLSRSDDGGASWIEVGMVTDQTTPWTTTASNIAPNQGDYLTLVADGSAVYPVWADGRFGSADIFFSKIPLAVTPTLASLVSAEALPDRVTLTWAAANAAGVSATVYRRETGGAWQPLAGAAFAGDGRLVYTDATVTAGATYDYRLGFREGGIESFSGETRVAVPTALDFGIASVRPNPTPRDVWVTFTLPRAERGSVELLDVSGRLVRSRDVSALGAGRHTLNLSDGAESLPAGVYLVRLRSGEREAIQRVSVVR